MEQFVERKGFTFFRSYYESAIKLPDKQRVAIFDAIVKYSFEGDIVALDSEDEIVRVILSLIKPTLDISIKRSNAGSKGGKINGQSHTNLITSKNEAYNMQNTSKTEAQENQTISDQETIIGQSVIEMSNKNVSGATPCAGGCGMDLKHSGFDEFWKAYPRKVGKVAAKKVWFRIKPTAELQANILAAIIQQKKSLQWQRDNGQFIPNPSTWLNQCRWDDELPVSVSNAKKPSFEQRNYLDDYLDQFVSNTFGNSV